jgi:hypothetical protein
MWKKFFEKLKKAIYRGVFGLVQTPTEKLFASRQA